MPWYTTQHAGDIAILRLKGDASTRVYQWLGGLDGLVMRGHRKILVGLEDVAISSASAAGFLVLFARRIEDVGAKVVFVAPIDAHAQKILRQTGLGNLLPFATTVEVGISDLSPRQK